MVIGQIPFTNKAAWAELNYSQDDLSNEVERQIEADNKHEDCTNQTAENRSLILSSGRSIEERTEKSKITLSTLRGL